MEPSQCKIYGEIQLEVDISEKAQFLKKKSVQSFPKFLFPIHDNKNELNQKYNNYDCIVFKNEENVFFWRRL